MTVDAWKSPKTGKTPETANFRENRLEKVATRAVFEVIHGVSSRALVQRTRENRCFDGRAPLARCTHANVAQTTQA